MTTLKDRQHQLREEAIVDAMAELLARQGYAATSMDDVAAALGLGKATLYLHFKSKSELALRVIIRQIAAAAADIRSADPVLPAIERLRRTLRAGLARRAALGAAQIQLPPELYADPAFLAAERQVARAGSALIREAQRAGDIRADLPPALVGEFITNVFNMNFERLLRKRADPDALTEQVIEMVIRAIRP